MGHIYDEVSSISPLLSEYDSLSNDELHEIAVEELEEECTRLLQEYDLLYFYPTYAEYQYKAYFEKA